MGRKDLFNYNYISMAEFLSEYVLPIVGTKATGNDKAKFTTLSHLDLDELNIPGVKRIGDEEALHYNVSDVILVGAKGYKHKGYEVHGYLRPTIVIKAQMEELGYSDQEIIDVLVNKNTEFDFSELTDLNRNEQKKVRERIKYGEF